MALAWPVFLLHQPCAEAVHRETLLCVSAAAQSMQAFPVCPRRPLRPSEELLQLFSSDLLRSLFTTFLGPPAISLSPLHHDKMIPEGKGQVVPRWKPGTF